MGFFTKDPLPQQSTSGELSPLSKDRIKEALESQNWAYSVDSDGDIGGAWEYGFFYFFVTGKQEEILHVRGTWRAQLTEEDMAGVLSLCNAWSVEKLWPKVYCRLADGILRVHTEHNVDYEHGLTEQQLVQHLVCAVETSMSFFETLNEAYPEAWAEYKPEN